MDGNLLIWVSCLPTAQLVNDTLEDSRATAGLSRLCIRRCAEEDPVDVSLLGGLYRRLLMCALSRVSEYFQYLRFCNSFTYADV